MNSIEFNEGYLKCLEELHAYMTKRKKPVTLMQLNADFLGPNIEKAHKDIDKVMQDMERCYFKDELERSKNSKRP